MKINLRKYIKESGLSDAQVLEILKSREVPSDESNEPDIDTKDENLSEVPVASENIEEKTTKPTEIGDEYLDTIKKIVAEQMEQMERKKDLEKNHTRNNVRRAPISNTPNFKANEWEIRN